MLSKEKAFGQRGQKGSEEEGWRGEGRGEEKMPRLPSKLIRVLHKGRTGSREAQINKRGRRNA